MSFIHQFPSPPADELIPDCFPSPFANTAHPLAELASAQCQNVLSQSETLQDYFANHSGIMMGVLVARQHNGELAYLCTYQGYVTTLEQTNWFVPPLIDSERRNRLLTEHQAERTKQEQRIQLLQNKCDQLQELLATTQRQFVERKAQRKNIRQQSPEPATLKILNQQSQQDRQKLKQIKQQLHQQQQAIELQQHELNALVQIEQQALLNQVVLTDARGENRSLLSFFSSDHKPGYAGQCAALKLLQYAIKHQLTPLALSEFWWGKMPKGEIRHHGQHYACCRSCCRPTLPFLLNHITHQPPPTHLIEAETHSLELLYEDEHIIAINKPVGLLSVPGNDIEDSVLNRLRKQFPEAEGPLLLHRLDLSTSGILLAAKNNDTHKQLQQQFIQRSIKKRYVAILNKALPTNLHQGEIELPLRVDLNDRPRQVVCIQYGKSARTKWQIIERYEKQTRVHFFPITGRTHQLRIHAAHPQGLNAPIVGDELYGQPDNRLLLHAEFLAITHPVTNQTLEFFCQAPF